MTDSVVAKGQHPPSFRLGAAAEGRRIGQTFNAIDDQGWVVDGELPLGKRIAVFRRLRGWTQDGLARRLNRSKSWVTKVERGERRVDSMSVLLEIARALSVPVHQLTGHGDHSRTAESRDNGLHPLRRVLDRSVSLGLPERPPRPGSQLVAEAVLLRRLYNSSDRGFSASAQVLADLIVEARHAAAHGREPDRRVAQTALAEMYRLMSLELRRRGDYGRARLAVDRALSAAEIVGDELLIASVSATLTVQLMLQGDPEDGVALATDTVDMLGRCRRSIGDPVSHSVINGALHLYAAQAAARAGNAADAEVLLKSAATIADADGADRERYSLIFGPTNVSIQTAGILVDLRRPCDAIREAERVRPGRTGSVNRTCYHHLHLARAHGMVGNDDATLDALMAARAVAPQSVAHDPLVQDQVRDLLRRKHSPDERLRRLANDVGPLD